MIFNFHSWNSTTDRVWINNFRQWRTAISSKGYCSKQASSRHSSLIWRSTSIFNRDIRPTVITTCVFISTSSTCQVFQRFFKEGVFPYYFLQALTLSSNRLFQYNISNLPGAGSDCTYCNTSEIFNHFSIPLRDYISLPLWRLCYRTVQNSTLNPREL